MIEKDQKEILEETGFCMHGNEPAGCDACKKLIKDQQEKISSLGEQQKEEKIKLIREKVDSIIDNLGEPIDPGIKEAVVVLNALDLPTWQSCEGHSDEEGYPCPWVIISDPNEPEIKYLDEDSTWDRIAKEHDMKVENLKRGKNLEVYFEALRKLSENGETEEYKKFQERNAVLLEKTQRLLNEFYKDRITSDKTRIIISEIDDGSFRIISKGRDEFDQSSKEVKQKYLEEMTKEMKDFTDFLLKKFLGNK